MGKIYEHGGFDRLDAAIVRFRKEHIPLEVIKMGLDIDDLANKEYIPDRLLAHEIIIKIMIAHGDLTEWRSKLEASQLAKEAVWADYQLRRAKNHLMGVELDSYVQLFPLAAQNRIRNVIVSRVLWVFGDVLRFD